jgi:hypothetical protein
MRGQPFAFMTVMKVSALGYQGSRLLESTHLLAAFTLVRIFRI